MTPADIGQSTMITGGRKLPSPTDKLISEVVSDCLRYDGRAVSQGATTDQAVWQISRTMIVGNVSYTQFAENAAYSAVWDDRATYFDTPGACTHPIAISYVGITDGTNKVVINPDGSFNIGGSISIQSVATEIIVNIPITAINTEQDYTLPSGTKAFMIKTRSGHDFKYSSVANSSHYLTLPVYEKEGIEGLPARKIYFQSARAGEVMEISSWI